MICVRLPPKLRLSLLLAARPFAIKALLTLSLAFAGCFLLAATKGRLAAPRLGVAPVSLAPLAAGALATDDVADNAPASRDLTEATTILCFGDLSERLIVSYGPVSRRGRGIWCFLNGKVVWSIPALVEGRHAILDRSASKTVFLEISGWPRESHLAVHRVSNGAVIGRAWNAGYITQVALGRDRVAVIEHDKTTWKVAALVFYDFGGRRIRTVPLHAREGDGEPEAFEAFEDLLFLRLGSQRRVYDWRGRMILRIPPTRAFPKKGVDYSPRTGRRKHALEPIPKPRRRGRRGPPPGAPKSV